MAGDIRKSNKMWHKTSTKDWQTTSYYKETMWLRSFYLHLG